jgi:UrcA family protein
MTSLISRCSNYRLTSTALAALTACFLLGATGAAHATQSADAAPSVRVAYGDLNLASEQGNSTLYARIVSAARAVCRVDDVDIRDLGALASARACESHAIAQAVSDVHSPKLAAIYSAHVRRG